MGGTTYKYKYKWKSIRDDLVLFDKFDLSETVQISIFKRTIPILKSTEVFEIFEIQILRTIAQPVLKVVNEKAFLAAICSDVSDDSDDSGCGANVISEDPSAATFPTQTSFLYGVNNKKQCYRIKYNATTETDTDIREFETTKYLSEYTNLNRLNLKYNTIARLYKDLRNRYLEKFKDNDEWFNKILSKLDLSHCTDHSPSPMPSPVQPIGEFNRGNLGDAEVSPAIRSLLPLPAIRYLLFLFIIDSLIPMNADEKRKRLEQIHQSVEEHSVEHSMGGAWNDLWREFKETTLLNKVVITIFMLSGIGLLLFFLVATTE